MELTQPDQKILEWVRKLKVIEDKIKLQQEIAEHGRQEIAKLMKKTSIQTVTDDFATVSLVTRKKYTYDKNTVLNYLKSKKIVVYYETKEVIKPEFEKDLKAGKLQGGWPEDIKLEINESFNTAIRYK